MTELAEAELPGAVRFITSYEEGREPGGSDGGLILSRVEGLRYCPKCSRAHPYQVGQIEPGEEASSEDHLFDSWEDAAYYVRKRLPECSRFYGRREPEDEDETEAWMFDNRTEAIDWLLAPV